MNPVLAGAIGHANHLVQNVDVGATAIRKGDLVKFSSGLIIPAADNDENLRVYVALERADALGTIALNTGCAIVPLSGAKLRMAYTGSTPTVGESYGISDQRTLDQANTTNLLLTVLAVDANQGFVDVIEYQIGA